jgi:hypothetical protein
MAAHCRCHSDRLPAGLPRFLQPESRRLRERRKQRAADPTKLPTQPAIASTFPRSLSRRGLTQAKLRMRDNHPVNGASSLTSAVHEVADRKIQAVHHGAFASQDRALGLLVDLPRGLPNHAISCGDTFRSCHPWPSNRCFRLYSTEDSVAVVEHQVPGGPQRFTDFLQPIFR